jgi:hypothetical protein
VCVCLCVCVVGWVGCIAWAIGFGISDANHTVSILEGSTSGDMFDWVEFCR